MGLVRDRWAPHSAETDESHSYKFKRVNNAVSTPWQKRRSTLTTNTCGENLSAFFLTRCIAIALGIRFIVMIIIWSAIIINSLFNQAEPIPLNESYCGPCPKNWLCYKENCYYFFNESKNWFQSQASCMSQNSSLLKIYSKEDQDFFKLVKSYHWMGLKKNSTNGIWQWEDGSILPDDLLTMVDMAKGTCAVYGSSFKGYTENCLSPYTYICMQPTV